MRDREIVSTVQSQFGARLLPRTVAYIRREHVPPGSGRLRDSPLRGAPGGRALEVYLGGSARDLHKRLTAQPAGHSDNALLRDLVRRASAVQFRYRRAKEDRTGLAGVKRAVYRVSRNFRGAAAVQPYEPVIRNNQKKETMWYGIPIIFICTALRVVTQARAHAVAPSPGVSRCLADSYSSFTRPARLPVVFYPFFSASRCRRKKFPPPSAAGPIPISITADSRFSDSGAKWWSSPAVLPRSLRVHRGEIRASPLPTDLGLPELLLEEVRELLRVHTRIP